ncbi:MAG: hypothetical protein ACOYK6_05835 [Chthoniobacterales bacterium]
MDYSTGNRLSLPPGKSRSSIRLYALTSNWDDPIFGKPINDSSGITFKSVSDENIEGRPCCGYDSDFYDSYTASAVFHFHAGFPGSSTVYFGNDNDSYYYKLEVIVK